MSTIPQQLSFDNYSSYGQQAVMADGSNMQKTQYYQVNNGQTATLQTYNGNQTSYQGNNTNAQLMSQGQPTVVNTTTYLHTPTYSPQALNETTTASNLMINNAVVSPTTTTMNVNTVNSQPISIPNTVSTQQQNQYIQTISPVEGNGMNFFSQLPMDNGMKNGQIINHNSPHQANMAIQQNNEQRYPSPPMGAIDLNKNQCQVTVATPLNIVSSAPNGYVSMNQGGITQAQQTQTMAIINTNGMNVANSNPYQQQNGGYQQYYNQSFTQIQGKGQQQTIISSTTNITSNYPQNNMQGNMIGNMNGKMGQGNILSVNQNVVNTPMTVKPNSRSKNKEPVPYELALKRQKNTEAARRSRMRKVLKMENLENHVKSLEADNKNLTIRLAMLESNRVEWETKEKKLLDKIKDLEAQLEEARKGQITEDTEETLKEVKNE